MAKTNKRSTQLVTAEELLHMKSRLDGWMYELENGVLILREPAGVEHGDVELALLTRLRSYVKLNKLGLVLGGDTGFTVARDPDTVLAPDVSFTRASRFGYGRLPRGYFEGAPDLAVEVMSPKDSVPKVDQKAETYLRTGTRLVWIVRPQDRSAIVRRADGSSARLMPLASLDGEDVVPGFTCALTDLFTDAL